MEKIYNTPIQYLKGVGPKKAELFSSIGIQTIEDLLYYFPRRYEDRGKFLPISQLKEGQHQTIKAKVLSKSDRHSWRRRRFSIFEMLVGDDTSQIICVWFNQGYLRQYFKPGQIVILYGKVERYSGRLQMSSPEFEIVDEPKSCAQGLGGSLNIGRIVPVYSLPRGLSQRLLRQLIKRILDEYLPKISDFLPYDIRSRNNLINLAKAFINIHFPENIETQKEAYLRLSFEEFLLFQIPLVLRKLKRKEKPGISHQIEGALVDSFLKNLVFELTKAQQKVISEIKLDMARPQPMQRLLQGDVGSGKTVVATIASLIAIQGGYQVAFMVPTEILAQQHYVNIKNQVSKIPAVGGSPPQNRRTGAYGGGNRGINIRLLTGSSAKKEKDQIFQEIKRGSVDLVIGTHSLLEESIKFRKLGLVVIDEQHKFGVGQRALLPQKGLCPDILIMTATPIPRTLAITIYGDLDVSIINELPAGRAITKTLFYNQENKLSAYEIIKGQLKKGQQAFIVLPVIEDSDILDITGAKRIYEELKKTEFKAYRLGLIHGRLKEKEQEEIMLKFKNRDLDVLVSTTVLEVGIDVPNATGMIIEYAERFGLSQLHQLRGRIGRASQESVCILISDSESKDSRQRLEAMVKYNSGFKIAEEDLKIRGPGEFFGQRQHGLTELKIANPLAQMQLLKKAREEAVKLLAKDPLLESHQHLFLREKLLQRFPGYEKLIMVG